MDAMVKNKGAGLAVQPNGTASFEVGIEPVELVGKVTSAGDVIRAVKKGLRVKSLDKLRSELDISSAQLGKTVNISSSTLRRRRKAGRLGPAESERVYRLGKIFHLAMKVLGSGELASQWMKLPEKTFGGATPLEYADTGIGAQEVERLLRRTAHGVYS